MSYQQFFEAHRRMFEICKLLRGLYFRQSSLEEESQNRVGDIREKPTDLFVDCRSNSRWLLEDETETTIA
jgi:hypothetical protein